MTETVKIRAWGNSQGIIIPQKVMTTVQWHKNDPLELITSPEGSILLRKKFVHKSFEERVAAYHEQIQTINYDFGEPKGKEYF